MTNRSVVISLFAIALSVQTAYVQSRSQSSGGGSLTPAVVATWHGHGAPLTVDLLVLWRGDPEWFNDRADVAVSGGGAQMFHVISWNGRRWNLAFDPMTRTVRVQDQVIQMENDNVILLDEIDGGAGIRVAGTMSVGPVTDENDPISAIIRTSPQLQQFVGCETELTHEELERRRKLNCSHLRQ